MPLKLFSMLDVFYLILTKTKSQDLCIDFMIFFLFLHVLVPFLWVSKLSIFSICFSVNNRSSLASTYHRIKLNIVLMVIKNHFKKNNHIILIIFCTEKNREIDFSYLFLAVLTFSHGLAKLPEVEQVVNWQHGTFNTPLFRIIALIAICALQAWLMLNFITFQLVRKLP